MSSNFVDLNQAAQLLGITPDELVEMRSQGEIFGLRSGSSWKFKMDELQRVAQERGLQLGASAASAADDSLLGGDSALDLDLGKSLFDDDGSEILSDAGPAPSGDSALSDLLAGSGELGAEIDEDAADSLLVSDDVPLVPESGGGSTIIGATNNPESDLQLAVDDDDDDVLGDIPLTGAGEGSSLLQGFERDASSSDVKLVPGDAGDVSLVPDSDELLVGPDEAAGPVAAAGDELGLADMDELELGSSVDAANDLDLGLGSEDAAPQAAADLELTPSSGTGDLDLSAGSGTGDLELDLGSGTGDLGGGTGDLDLSPGSGTGDLELDLGSGDAGTGDLELSVGSGTGDLELSVGSGTGDLELDSGGLELDSDVSGDDDDLVLGDSAVGSDVTLGAGDTGINLTSAADSGLSLEEDPIEFGGAASSLELPDEDMISLDDDADPLAATQLKQDEEFLLSPGDGLDDDESGSQVIALEDSAALDPDSATLLGDSSFQGLEAQVQPQPLGQPGMGQAMGAGMGAAMGGAMPGAVPGGMGVPAGAAQPQAPAAPAEAPYSVLNVLSLMSILAVLGLTGMLMMDIVRNMWTWNANEGNIATSLMDGILSALSMK